MGEGVSTFSMTEKVSWYLVIMRRRFQDVLAVSSPSGCRISPAMSIRSIPEGGRIEGKMDAEPKMVHKFHIVT